MSRCILRTKDGKKVAVGIEIPALGGNWFLQVFEENEEEPTVDFETRSNTALIEKLLEVGVDRSDKRTLDVLKSIAMDLDPGPSYHERR